MPSFSAFLVTVNCGFCLQILLLHFFWVGRVYNMFTVFWTLSSDMLVLLTNVEVFMCGTAINRS